MVSAFPTAAFAKNATGCDQHADTKEWEGGVRSAVSKRQATGSFGEAGSFRQESGLAAVWRHMWDLRGREKGRAIDVEEKAELGSYQPVSTLSTARRV